VDRVSHVWIRSGDVLTAWPMNIRHYPVLDGVVNEEKMQNQGA
jgi:thymidylate synthase